MKKKSLKKLTLNRETLHDLQMRHLGGLVGGGETNTCPSMEPLPMYSDCACPDSNNSCVGVMCTNTCEHTSGGVCWP